MEDELPTRRVSADEGETVRVPAQKRDVVFQRYDLQRKLAAGGMGEVWFARDTVQGTEAALKFLKEDFAADAQAVNELKQEVLNSLKLNHQNILRVYRFEVDETAPQISRRFAISMEFIRGTNLRDLREQRWRDRKVDYFEPEELLPWVLQTCDAIHYAHERKLVHRDIKPANLMLDEHNAVKVCDFGIGRTVTETSSGRTQNNAGTIPYMSRQQREFYKAAPSDDVYAIGATIYDLLTGNPPRYVGKQVSLPFDEKPPRMAEWRKKSRTGGGSAPIPEHWEKVVELCLSDDPARRPASARQVRDMLEQKSVPSGPALGQGQETGSKLWILAVAAILMFAAAGIGVYYYWDQNIRLLPEVQQLIAAGKVSADEGQKLNTLLRGPDGHEKRLAARLAGETLDPASWRVYTALVPAETESQVKLRQLFARDAIKEEEFNLLVKDLGAPEDSPYRVLARQLVYDKTLTSAQWRDSRAKILDPLVEKIRLLVSAGSLTASESETLRGDHARTDESREAALAHKLLEENSLTVEQWRKERFPAPATVAAPTAPVDPVKERLNPLVAAGTINAREAEWLHGVLSGPGAEAEKSLAERLLGKEITPGVWRARTTLDYRLKEDGTLDPANLPPAIDLALNDSTALRLLRIDPGTFFHGSAKDELGRRSNELGQETVAVARPYYIGMTEVTQAQYLAIMPRNPSYWRNNPNWPVDQVDWTSVAGSNGFIARLNAALSGRLGGVLVADLPTEDEWEYACRAGTQTSFNNGKHIGNTDSDSGLDPLANYNRAASGSPRPVASFQPNAWGLFDMHGNLAEWSQNRFIRGGSWQSKAANCRAASRVQGNAEALGSNQTGFRLVLRLKEKDKGN